MADFSVCTPESGLIHNFCSETETWESSEVIVRIEKKPFGKGLTRQAYRLQLVNSNQYATIEHIDWNNAVQCVGKSANTDDGEIEIDCDRDDCFHSARLQHEALRWADSFNTFTKTEVVKVIKCSVLELCDRPNHPVISCESIIEGDNRESLHFSVYNSTAVTTNFAPLAYFLYSFYASYGTSIVVHLEGAEGIYTNPQVLSFR
jgi:hypothetical protein